MVYTCNTNTQEAEGRGSCEGRSYQNRTKLLSNLSYLQQGKNQLATLGPEDLVAVTTYSRYIQ